jgi:prepilin-type N-terminal cleavage/methylation domain-containing protein
MNKPARQRGTTLIELSVVIAVLLLLVGVLFIGITAWKNGSHAAACIVNLASIQKAARGYQDKNYLDVSHLALIHFIAAKRCPAFLSQPLKLVSPKFSKEHSFPGEQIGR